MPRYLEDSDGTSVYSGVSLLPTENIDYNYLNIEHGRKSALARPWSLIGRKGNRSETSSMIGSEANDKASVLSPNLLPTLFLGGPTTAGAVRSPLRNGFLPDDEEIPSIHHYLTESPIEQAQNPLENLKIGENLESDDVSSSLPDLTENLVKEGQYPIAHGGYSDVWRATWNKENLLKVIISLPYLASSETLLLLSIGRREGFAQHDQRSRYREKTDQSR